MLSRLNRLAIVACAILLFAESSRAQTAAYDRIEIKPTLKNILWTRGLSLNDLGDLAGYVRSYDLDTDLFLEHGYYYERATKTFIYSAEGQIFTEINNFGEIVGGHRRANQAPFWDWAWDLGYYYNGKLVSADGIGLYWSQPTAEPLPLPPLYGDTTSIPTGINDQGLAVGLSGHEIWMPVEASAVVWQTDPLGVSDPFVLPALPGHVFSAASAISPANQNGVCTIMGQSGSGWNSEDEFPVRWKVKLKADGSLRLTEGPIVIGPASVTSNPGAAHCGIAVNSRGYAAVQIDFEQFRVNNGLTLTPLQRLEINGMPATQGAVSGVNEFRDIVGFQGILPGVVYRATIWPAGRQPVDLNSLYPAPTGRALTHAFDINNLGEIVCQEAKSNNGKQTKTVLLVPKN